MVTADEVSRSLRGAAAFLNREPDALGRFEVSGPAFRRSFAAVLVTLPAFVVKLALQRRELGLPPSRDLFDDSSLAALMAAGHFAGFVALPLAMALLLRRSAFADRYVPFVIVTNWIAAFGSFALAVPGILLLLGLATPALAQLFTVAFGTVLVFVHWHATRASLGTDAVTAAAVAGLGLLLARAESGLVQSLAAALSG